MDNKTALFILMFALIATITILTILGVIFIVALRRRAPVVKIVMAPQTGGQDDEDDEDENEEEEKKEEARPEPVEEKQEAEEAEPVVAQEAPAEAVRETPPAAEIAAEPEEDEDEEEEDSVVVEGQERVYYDRSLKAKLARLKRESKDWYGELKNELLSYDKMKSRMSWRRETFRVKKMTIARFIVRGKTLCLLLAVEANGYAGTKYSVEDVSNTVSLSDTPTLYRIKNARRLKYAKEMIAGIMKELKAYKSSAYVPQDFYVPYEEDAALIQRGLVRRVVSNSSLSFKADDEKNKEAEVAAAELDGNAGEE